MNDEEMFFAVVILVAAYWYFGVRGKGGSKQLRGNRAKGNGSTRPGIASGGSKAPTRFQNGNPQTNAHQGTGYRAAPIAQVGSINGQGTASNPGTRSGQASTRSSTSRGIVSSFISPSWPTRRVTSTGTTPISSGNVQIPSYTAVPLSIQGPGGGGSWLH